MNHSVELLLKDTLNAVLDAIELHKNGQPAPLSISFLNKTKLELEQMIKIMDPSVYKPMYPRFALDWPDDSELMEKLFSASYMYGKIKVRK
ncbi:hypothetical protein H5A21_20055 [Pectobacterium aquaticum]|nr:hypothetical protein [Pectobacterium aquaticum]MBN3066303.1 hypothetical protein [Pectobacterium aquaticum]